MPGENTDVILYEYAIHQNQSLETHLGQLQTYVLIKNKVGMVALKSIHTR